MSKAREGGAPGDVAVFETLYRRHYEELLRFAARRVEPEAARDVVADVFLVLWRRREDVEAGSARAWLFGVARMTLRNEYRSQARQRRLADAATFALRDGSRQDFVAIDTERNALMDMLGRLSNGEREALELTEWEELSSREAAQVVGCSPAAFRVRLHRARRHLLNLYAESSRGTQSTDRDAARTPPPPSRSRP